VGRSPARNFARGALLGLTLPLWLPFRAIPPLRRGLEALDQFGNAVLPGGDPDETLSSRLGKAKLRHGGRVPWRLGLGLPRLLDELLETLDPGHSLDAIEGDEGDRVHLPPGHPRAPKTPHAYTYGRCFHCGGTLHRERLGIRGARGLTWCHEHATAWLDCPRCQEAARSVAPRSVP
jgi:hypothetical protein